MKDPTSLIWAKVVSFGNGFFLLLPNMVAGIVFLAVAWFAGRFLEQWIGRLFRRESRADLGSLLGSIAFGVVLVVALLIAAAIVIPSVQPASILSTLGIGSVAIGFAFKDILQNLLAGLLILMNRPYRSGDQIKVKGYEGTVEHIESRATLIRTYDGRRVIIPNSDAYTSPVEVNTAFGQRRDTYDVGVSRDADVEQACRIFAQAAEGVDGVEMEAGKPDALAWGLEAAKVTIRVRWWAASRRKPMAQTRAGVILALAKAAQREGIQLA